MLPGKAFQLVAGHVALDFVNTLDNRFRPEATAELLETPADLAQFAVLTRMWNSAQSFTPGPTDMRSVQGARELREILAHIFYSIVDDREPPTEDLTALDQHLVFAAAYRRLVPEKSRLRWIWQPVPGKSELDLLQAQIAFDAAQLLTSDSMEHVHACENEGCRWLFLDTSKNHGRRWCDMKLCGNRMKARRFYEQHRKA